MRAIFEQVLVIILRQHSVACRSDELEISRVGLIDRRIRRSIELMHSQLDQDLSLKDLAAASYLSPFHFARLFKKITGVTPHNYLAAIRTQKAQLLLAENELSINAIAARVGYLSSSLDQIVKPSADYTDYTDFDLNRDGEWQNSVTLQLLCVGLNLCNLRNLWVVRLSAAIHRQ